MKNFIAILITIIPFLIVFTYVIVNTQPNSGINWIQSVFSGIVLVISYNYANKYREKNK